MLTLSLRGLGTAGDALTLHFYRFFYKTWVLAAVMLNFWHYQNFDLVTSPGQNWSSFTVRRRRTISEPQPDMSLYLLIFRKGQLKFAVCALHKSLNNSGPDWLRSQILSAKLHAHINRLNILLLRLFNYWCVRKLQRVQTWWRQNYLTEHFARVTVFPIKSLYEEQSDCKHWMNFNSVGLEVLGKR